MDVYTRLADYINEIYELGLEPHDDSRAFVKLFRLLLKEEEAELAMALTAELEDPRQISSRTEHHEDLVSDYLRSISSKGIIYEQIEGNTKCYKLIPFIPGIFEALVGMADRPEIADCLQEYSDEMQVYKNKHTITTIPVNRKIKIETQQVSMKEIELYLENTNQYAVLDCICRTIAKTRGNACGHSIKDMCIIIGDYTEYYIKLGNAREVTRQEVREILIKAEAEGLYHEMYPIEKSKSCFICNCCICGCMFLGLSNRLREVIYFENTVKIDISNCTLCGICVEKCPAQVFSWSEDGRKIEINSELCFGCGLCKLVCKCHAVSLNE